MLARKIVRELPVGTGYLTVLVRFRDKNQYGNKPYPHIDYTVLWNEQLPGTDGPVIFRRDTEDNYLVQMVQSSLGAMLPPSARLSEKSIRCLGRGTMPIK
jgi:hypothetical protein